MRQAGLTRALVSSGGDCSWVHAAMRPWTTPPPAPHLRSPWLTHACASVPSAGVAHPFYHR